MGEPGAIGRVKLAEDIESLYRPYCPKSKGRVGPPLRRQDSHSINVICIALFTNTFVRKS